MYISVFMTIKNGQNFIQRSIRSVLNQTVLPKEIVIVDDGSTDDTPLMVQDLANQADIPIILINTSGLGRAKSLNLAIQNCTGNWVANLDVDDYWLPHKLEMQAALMKTEPNAKIIITESIIHYEKQTVSFENENIGFDLIYTKLDQRAFYARNPVNHSSIIFCKEAFDRVGRYNELLNKQIDYDLWIRFLISQQIFYRVDIPLTVKYLHSNQSFEAKNVFSYRYNALNINFQALKKLDAPFSYYFKSILFFVSGFTPRLIKKFIKTKFYAKKY